MRKLLLSLLLVLLAAPLAAQDDSLQKVLENGVLRVGAEPGTPPMLFKTGARYDGFDWAIANAIAKRLRRRHRGRRAGQVLASCPAA